MPPEKMHAIMWGDLYPEVKTDVRQVSLALLVAVQTSAARGEELAQDCRDNK